MRTSDRPPPDDSSAQEAEVLAAGGQAAAPEPPTTQPPTGFGARHLPTFAALWRRIRKAFRPRPAHLTSPAATKANHGLTGLRIYAFMLLVVPADTVLKPVGAAAFPGGVIAMGLFGWWLASTLTGQHDPSLRPTPIRLSVLVLWVATLVSYTAMALALPTVVQVNSADRWILQLAGWTGVILVAGDSLRTMADFRALIRAIAWGGSVMAFVAILQFWANIDLAETLRLIPGFTKNAETVGIDARASLSRVAGTSLHPIDLGVVSATILPLLLVNALYDRARSPASRWIPVALVGMCIPISVSRSAIIAIAISLGVLIPCLNPRHRLATLGGVVVAVVTSFMTAPGLIGTLRDFFFLGSDDSSVATRQNDIPIVERMVTESPWVGHGPGTYLAEVPNDNLDNQYFGMFIEFGVIGTVAIALAYLLLPAVVVFAARKRIGDEATRTLGAALGGAALVGFAVAATFDSFGFPMYAGAFTLVVGMIGAYWRLAETTPRLDTPGPPETD